MAQHDPFWFIYHYLRLNTDPSQLPVLREKMERIRGTFREVRFDSYDYSDPLFQSAYLLEYFPLYIDIIDDLLVHALWWEKNHYPQSQPGADEMAIRERLDVALYGGGPEPELFGLLKFLKRDYPSVNAVRLHYLDKNDWERFRTFSHNYLIQYYWGKDFESGENIRMDLCDLFRDPRAMDVVRHSDVHIMQHCATDLMHSFNSVDRYRLFLREMYDQMKPGALFIGIDVPVYSHALPSNPSDMIHPGRSFMDFLEYSKECPGTRPLIGPDLYNPREITPEIVRNHAITRSLPLKQSVKYHSFAVRKGE